MSIFFSRTALVAGSALFLFVSFAAAQDTKDDDRAKEVYGQFIKAVQAKDLDAMMKVVDVPWLSHNLATRNKKEIRKSLKDWKGLDYRENKGKIEVLPYAQFRAMLKKDTDEEEFAKEVDKLKLTKNDRVIIESNFVVLIRIREGKAKIVGVPPVPISWQSADAVKVMVAADKPDADGKQTITINLTLKKPWRVMANSPGNKKLEPPDFTGQTKVTIGGKGKPEVVKIDYPPGTLVKDKDLGDFRVYDDKAEIKAVVRRAKGDLEKVEVSVFFVPDNYELGICLVTSGTFKATVP